MDDSQIVYFSRKSGKKYHYNKGCLKSSLKSDKMECPISQAKEWGLELCQVCNSNKNYKFYGIKNYNNQNSENKRNKFPSKIMNPFINSEDADDTIFNNISKIEGDDDYKENDYKEINIYKEINEKHKDENKKEAEKKSKPIFNYTINFNIDPSRIQNKKEAEDVYEKIKIIRGDVEKKANHKENNINNDLSINSNKNAHSKSPENLKNEEKKINNINEKIIQKQNISCSINNTEIKSNPNESTQFQSKINLLNQNQLNRYALLRQKNKDYNDFILKHCKKDEKICIQETYDNANILSFNSQKVVDVNSGEKKGNEELLQDSYKFSFQITRKENINDNMNEYLIIEVGFKINYINIEDMNLVFDEKMIDKENIKYKIGSLCDSLIIKKKLIIFHSTGVVHVMIDINKGKFFIVGEEEIENNKQNMFLNEKISGIFYTKDFVHFDSECLEKIEPIFINYKSKQTKFEIKLNNKLK